MIQSFLSELTQDSTLCSLGSYNSLLTQLSTHRYCTFPSAWNVLCPDATLAYSPTSFRSAFRCHLLSEASFDHSVRNCYLYNYFYLLFQLTFPHGILPLFNLQYVLFVYFIFLSISRCCQHCILNTQIRGKYFLENTNDKNIQRIDIFVRLGLTMQDNMGFHLFRVYVMFFNAFYSSF